MYEKEVLPYQVYPLWGLFDSRRIQNIDAHIAVY
jgi:hypothetical protein